MKTLTLKIGSCAACPYSEEDVQGKVVRCTKTSRVISPNTIKAFATTPIPDDCPLEEDT